MPQKTYTVPEALDRLEEAVNAIRDIKGMPSAVWRKNYASFVSDMELHHGPTLNNNMQFELILRQSEYAIALGRSNF